MRILTKSELKQWCAEQGVQLDNRGIPIHPGAQLHSIRFRLPEKISQLTWFCQFIEASLQPREHCLFWVTRWDVSPSSENWHLYYRLRESYGDQRLDGNGNVTGVTDPLGHATTMTYNGQGRMTSAADTLGHTISFGYTNGLMSSITDPLGQTTTLVNDGAGHTVESTDPLGNSAFYDYDLLDDVDQVTDPNGGVTSFSYDADRNLTGVTDGNGNRTTYGYDSMDRRVSRTDALNVSESFSYDDNGNLLQHTDRRGTVDKFSYDGLNRRTLAGFGYSSGSYQDSISYTYDGGDRLTQAVDSTAGTIARTYDGLDRLTAEQTPQGEVTYSYDAEGRRTAMTVAGQSAVGYTWDNANRLTAIAQGSGTVGFAYDNANRRATLTLPNGVTVTYAYNGDSRVTQLSYGTGGSGSSDLGTLTYAYDADGRVVRKGGTLAATGMPAAVSGNTINADNAMTGFNGTPLSYDANGNLTGDGTNTYTWDARNNLSAISGPVDASFVYDAFSRRMSKNVSGTTTQFVYDGLNPVQELDGASPPDVTANLLTGLGIDEYFTRSDSGGPVSFLTDALGSTVALTNSSGSINVGYAYEPFGNVTMSGSNSNPYQFTGRENDNTGLYYYRARYYSPTYQRFVGQDPLDYLGDGSNLYAYTIDDPVNNTDLLGLRSLTACEKDKLKGFIPQIDLDNADVHENEVLWFTPHWAGGITLHNDIYFRPGNGDTCTIAGLAQLAHELTHVGQYRLGMTEPGYILTSLIHGYEHNPYEQAAYAKQEEVQEHCHGACPCKK